MIDDMVRTLIDKRDTELTIEKAIDILRCARYPFPAIAAHVEAAINKANKWLMTGRI